MRKVEVVISETSKICTQTLPSKCSEPLESEEAGAFSPYLIFKEHEISAFSGSRLSALASPAEYIQRNEIPSDLQARAVTTRGLIVGL